MRIADAVVALGTGDNVMCSNGTIYRLADDGNSLEVLPESRINQGNDQFKTKGSGDALRNPVSILTDDEVDELVHPTPATIEVPTSELAALRTRIQELEALAR